MQSSDWFTYLNRLIIFSNEMLVPEAFMKELKRREKMWTGYETTAGNKAHIMINLFLFLLVIRLIHNMHIILMITKWPQHWVICSLLWFCHYTVYFWSKTQCPTLQKYYLTIINNLTKYISLITLNMRKWKFF